MMNNSSQYGELFSLVYNKFWNKFAENAALLFFNFYQKESKESKNKKILDVCCGTGQLALFFAQKGYEVTGIDISASMLEFARKNAESKKNHIKHFPKFIQCNARNFKFDDKFAMAIATFDAMNHFDNLEDLYQCFVSVHNSIDENGFFAFDMNTKKHIENWNDVRIEDHDDVFFITKDMFINQYNKAFMNIIGFVKQGEYYQRFDELLHNTIFLMDDVKKKLHDSGFKSVSFHSIKDLAIINLPENEDRVFIVARKQ